jgi:hypothetical protein
MNDLHKALGDISDIRRQMARSTEFRGYGPATLAATGVFALAAASLQARWVEDPAHQVERYLTVWMVTAVLSAALAWTHMCRRSRRIHSVISDEMIHMAVEQFMPAVGAGLLLTVAIVRSVPQSEWMLPGLWQIIFSLGIFSSCRFLPRPIFAAGAWYLLTGLICIGFGGRAAFSPWAMGIPFGVGQALVAGILFFTSKEDGHEDEDSFA